MSASRLYLLSGLDSQADNDLGRYDRGLMRTWRLGESAGGFSISLDSEGEGGWPERDTLIVREWLPLRKRVRF
jgi:hypothetical protein